MSDLISRRDAIDAVESLPNAYNGWSDAYDKACIIGVLEELPSADVVQVVRCKDCKFYGTTDCQIQESLYGIKDFDFCSYGERKGGDYE